MNNFNLRKIKIGVVFSWGWNGSTSFCTSWSFVANIVQSMYIAFTTMGNCLWSIWVCKAGHCHPHFCWPLKPTLTLGSNPACSTSQTNGMIENLHSVPSATAFWQACLPPPGFLWAATRSLGNLASLGTISPPLPICGWTTMRLTPVSYLPFCAFACQLVNPLPR